jgi:hypothetical protein
LDCAKVIKFLQAHQAMKEWHVRIAKCNAMCAKCDPKLHEIIQVGPSRLLFKWTINVASYKRISNVGHSTSHCKLIQQ